MLKGKTIQHDSQRAPPWWKRRHWQMQYHLVTGRWFLSLKLVQICLSWL